MALETGTYINSLNTSNPAATDALSQADEHLRLIKATVKATFPNVDAAVTATPTELNKSTAIVSDGTNATFNTGITAAKIKTLIGLTDSSAITTNTDSEGEVTPVLATGVTADEVRTLIGAATLLAVYPVGSIYTSIVSTSPGTHFGGTWVSFGQGRVLVGHDDAADPDTDFVAPSGDGSSVLLGGAKTHTLSVDEIPSHTHGISNFEDPTGTGSNGSANGASSFSTVNTDATGGGGAHNNLQPYVVVYMWKRTV
jgi:hypothetical protein